jgi:hypothetical protein
MSGFAERALRIASFMENQRAIAQRLSRKSRSISEENLSGLCHDKSSRTKHGQYLDCIAETEVGGSLGDALRPPSGGLGGSSPQRLTGLASRAFSTIECLIKFDVRLNKTHWIGIRSLLY